MDNTREDKQNTGSGIAMVFEDVFKSHFRQLHAYAFTIVKDEAEAEEIVQNVFFKIWEKKEQLQINSISAYLYKSVYYESLNALKHTQRVETRKAKIARGSDANTSGNPAEHRELSNRIDLALSQLPEQCRTVFQLSRFEDLKYKGIAERLGISVKTVETHMSKALRLLREKLADYLPLIILFINLKNILP